jgi:diaminopimelate decarboxylase
VGLHQHIGSGVFDRASVDGGLRGAARARWGPFRALQIVDAGGGFGVPYRPDESPVDLPVWGRAITARFDGFNAASQEEGPPRARTRRYVVCEAGVLLARVTTVKRTRDRVSSSASIQRHAPPHAARDLPVLAPGPRAYPRRDVTRRSGCLSSGPICESGDVLAEERTMVVPREGDLVVVGNAGAYGFAMASHYNLRALPAEVLVDGDRARLVRKRESYRDVVRTRDVKGG